MEQRDGCEPNAGKIGAPLGENHMSASQPPEVTRWLSDLGRGDASAADRLMSVVYDELRALAQSCLQRERPDHTLQATALVHEAYLRLVDQTRVEWQGRAHFFAIAAEVIRRVLVDHARSHRALKRGGAAQRLTLFESAVLGEGPDGVELLTLDEALRELATHSERQARVVELRFFGGLSVEETAAVLDVSPRTVKDDWRFARALLRRRLGEGAAS